MLIKMNIKVCGVCNIIIEHASKQKNSLVSIRLFELFLQVLVFGISLWQTLARVISSHYIEVSDLGAGVDKIR